MRHNLVPPSSARSVYVPAEAPSKKKGGKGALVIGILVLLVGAGVVYLLRRPVVNEPTETAKIWHDYISIPEPERGDMPTGDETREKASACLTGLPGTGDLGSGNPGYAGTDQVGRATAAWLCIYSGITEGPDTACNYPTGTYKGMYGPNWKQGHLISFKFSGDGTKRDERGCQNVTPQTGQVNKKIADGPEAYVKQYVLDKNTDLFYVAIPQYRVDDTREPEFVARPDWLYYFVFTDAGAPVYGWVFDNRNLR